MPKVYARVLSDAGAELGKALKKFPRRQNSAHESYAVILEELDELWDEVKVKQKKRSIVKMRKEAIQVAAMALRFAMEVCDARD
jgi:glutamyl-tRNA reductase